MPRRIRQIDFFKGVFILLMVTFHLIYIGDSYPYAKQVVYTFHMPGFLLLSGYLMKRGLPARRFWRHVWWLFLPYAVMEAGYVVMSALLPVREAVDHLTLPLLLDKLLLHPLGPYWYLHTLILCLVISRVVERCPLLWPWSALTDRASRPLSDAAGLALSGQRPSAFRGTRRFILSMVLILLLSQFFGLLNAANGLYFMLGVLLAEGGCAPRTLLWRSWWVLLPLVLLCAWPQALHRATPAGMLIIYLVFSLLTQLHRHLPQKMAQCFEQIGRHSLPIYLFSPLFTMALKFAVPLFTFDPTGLIYCTIALSLTTVGSLLIAKLLDTLRLTPYLFGKERIVRVNWEKSQKGVPLDRIEPLK